MNSFDYSLTSKPDKCAAETLLNLMVNTGKGALIMLTGSIHNTAKHFWEQMKLEKMNRQLKSK